MQNLLCVCACTCKRESKQVDPIPSLQEYRLMEESSTSNYLFCYLKWQHRKHRIKKNGYRDGSCGSTYVSCSDVQRYETLTHLEEVLYFCTSWSMTLTQGPWQPNPTLLFMELEWKFVRCLPVLQCAANIPSRALELSSLLALQCTLVSDILMLFSRKYYFAQYYLGRLSVGLLKYC